jgi:LL-H family phage holin
MNEVLFNVLLFIVIVCTVAISGTIIPWIKTQIHESEYAEFLDIVEQAVKALEQTVKASGQGKIKKAEVIAFVTSWLNTHKIEITEKQLDTLIEAAVWTMNNKDKK